MRSLSCVPLLFLLLSTGDSAVITGACDRDLQCGGGMCCAVSLWIRSLRMCTPMGTLGEDCHPLSHKANIECCFQESTRNIYSPTDSILGEENSSQLSMPT
ncbi:prokineticin-2 isoform X2 [Podarcis raffonei]|uniref:prokineticin-2 isoform X2 n=1 Tax=Podarcis raffonei TaxID=65483 RepID=UPI0023291551|nr:prokineticin-2 isoform X2 [Podarcis raffonei]